MIFFLASGLPASAATDSANGPLIFQPYIGARIYSAILENTLVGGKRGLSFYGVGSFDPRSGPSTVAVAAAFPFSKLEKVKTAGWAFGFAYGNGTFSYEKNRYVTPELRFIEAMVGRTSVEGQDSERSGFGGYFEITLRNEQLLPNAEYEQIVATYGRLVPPNNRSLNLRIGSVSGLGGHGFVDQKPNRYVGHSYHLGISMPLLDDQSTTVHLQAKVFAYCRAESILCGLNAELHHARAPVRLAGIQDLENQFFGGPFIQFFFQKKYVLSVAANYTLAANQSRSIGSSVPLLKSSFSIAF